MMRTVREELMTWAEERGIEPAEYLRLWSSNHIDPSLPERYQHLIMEVLLRLPAGWDDHAEWYISLGQEKEQRGYGSALRLEEEDYGEGNQNWDVCLYPVLLDRLSDPACKWVIAHELAHVASRLPTGSLVIDGRIFTRINGKVDQYVESPSKEVQEDAATRIALEWGFGAEQETFLIEDKCKNILD